MVEPCDSEPGSTSEVPEATVVITAFQADDEGHWVADLSCGHRRHFRHNPPWTQHPWVVTAEGRADHMGRSIACTQCLPGADAP